jgi:hypothetical protein
MRRLFIGLVALAAVSGCSGADEGGVESLGETEQALARKQVIVSDGDGNLWGWSSGVTFAKMTLAPNTKAAAVAAGNVGQRGDYYITQDSRLFERDSGTAWLQRFGGTFLDITSVEDTAYAVSVQGTVLVKQPSGDFDYVEEMQVRPEGGALFLLSRIDACKNGDILAVSADQRRAFKYYVEFQAWGILSLDSVQGPTLDYIQDVACGDAGIYAIAGKDGHPPGVYRKRDLGIGWDHVAGGSMFIPRRVEADALGFAWFTASDSFNGSRLWRVAADGTLKKAVTPGPNNTTVELKAPFDVGG